MASAIRLSMDTPHRIKPTSTRCQSAWWLNLGRCSTYRRGDSVQTAGTSSDFLALQRDKLFVRIIFVELRAKIYGVNPRIISFNEEKVLSLEPDIVFLYN